MAPDPRAWLRRLLAIALAVLVGGTAGLGGQVPRALRSSIDPAAEVVGARAPIIQRSASQHSRRSQAPATSAFRLRGGAGVAGLEVVPRPPTTGPDGGGDWPAARSGAQILLRKSSRLI